jgi:trigger factor
VKVKVYPTNGCTRELRVEVEAETVQAEVDRLYASIAKEAVLPGFRKGKAPLSIVKGKYKAHVKEEMLRESLPRFFREAVQQEKIDPIAQPRITEYTFEEAPPCVCGDRRDQAEIVLQDYKGLKNQKPRPRWRTPMSIRPSRTCGTTPPPSRRSRTFDRANEDMVHRLRGKVDGKLFDGGKANATRWWWGMAPVLKDFEDPWWHGQGTRPRSSPCVSGRLPATAPGGEDRPVQPPRW